jgi:hypothetical protein
MSVMAEAIDRFDEPMVRPLLEFGVELGGTERGGSWLHAAAARGVDLRIPSVFRRRRAGAAAPAGGGGSDQPRRRGDARERAVQLVALQHDARAAPRRRHPARLLRLSIGLEGADELIADLRQAVAATT